MALWKPFRGNREALETQPLHDGYVYFCVDDGSLFFDYTDADGNLQRKQINAKDAETITGVSLEEIRNEIAAKADLVDGKVPLSQLPEMSIDTSELATKEDLGKKLDAYYGDNTFPYSDQGYNTDMERNVVYTVSSIDYGSETIYFEEGTHVSFWFEYDGWVGQIKAGDKIVLSTDEYGVGYLYLNPMTSAKDISDEIKELSKALDNKISKSEEVFVFSYNTRVEWFDPTEYSFPYDEILTISSIEEDGEIEQWDDEYGDYIYETAYIIRFEGQDDFTLRCILYPSDRFMEGTKIIIKRGDYDMAYEEYYPDIYRIDEASLGVIAIVSSDQSFEYNDILNESTITFIDHASGYESLTLTGNINLDKPTLYAGTNSKCFVTISYTRDDVWDEESEMYDGSLSGDGYWMSVAPGGDFELTIEIPYDEEARYNGHTIYLATECKQGLTEIPVSKIKAGEGIKLAENNGILEISTTSTPSADASDQIEDHNTSFTAHEDIRNLIANLNTLVGNTNVSSQISEAVAQKSQVQIITWEDDD